ncbi:MAG: ribbon-helix-helix protein, CopG family [Gemmatimonadota bacterium]|nr:ribbon-helix-helix protein, CopG family [Gemmatimonadota bacterium]
MPKPVREPIQVYLTPAERAELDRAARELGVSRSEALRRGIEAVTGTANGGALRDLAAAGYVTPPAVGPGAPPPSVPVAPLETLLAELADDRGRP